MRNRALLLLLVAFLMAIAVACGGDDDDDDDTGGGGNTTETTADDGGGSAQAGAPEFVSFEASSEVPCEGGNATVDMSYETINVVSIEIRIGDGNFEETAGYGPNETGVVAEIPCEGAGESSVTLKGCTEDNECAESDRKTVTITAG